MPWTTAEAAREAVELAPPVVRTLAVEWIRRNAADSELVTGAFVCGMLAVLQPGALAPPLLRPPYRPAAAPPAPAAPTPAVEATEESDAAPPPDPDPLQEETAPSPASPAALASLEAAEAWCRAEGYTKIDHQAPSFPGAGQYSVDHEPGALWLWFPKAPQAPERARLKRTGFKGVYEGTRTDRRGRVRKNFAGWRWAADA